MKRDNRRWNAGRKQRERRARLDRLVTSNQDARKLWPVQERVGGVLVQKLRLPEPR